MGRRSISWVKEGDGAGLEFAEVEIGRGRLTAAGTMTAATPVPYRLEYRLETRSRFVTSGLLVEARGVGWSRSLDLRRLRSGRWTLRTRARGESGLPPPGGDMSQLGGALDCDLAWSPMTNTMPVLRHGLLDGGGPIELLMAWVSVPDLHVHPSGQRYTFVRREGGHSIVRYESSSGDFVADITFDAGGLVLDYPGIGRAVGTA